MASAERKGSIAAERLGPGGVDRNAINPTRMNNTTLGAVTGYAIEGSSAPEATTSDTERMTRAMCMAALVCSEYWVMKATGRTLGGHKLDREVVITIDGHERELTFDEFEAEYAPWA